jgi:multidrug resistance efflux pump
MSPLGAVMVQGRERSRGAMTEHSVFDDDDVKKCAPQAEAAFDSAQQQVAQADINLKRTRVRSPVNGYAGWTP